MPQVTHTQAEEPQLITQRLRDELDTLEVIMGQVQPPSPCYQPYDLGPSAADLCQSLFALVRHVFDSIDSYMSAYPDVHLPSAPRESADHYEAEEPQLNPTYAEDINIYLYLRLVGVDPVEGARITMGKRTWIVMGIVDFGTKVRIGLLEPEDDRATPEALAKAVEAVYRGALVTEDLGKDMADFIKAWIDSNHAEFRFEGTFHSDNGSEIIINLTRLPRIDHVGARFI
jgi:hypothetical protein